MPGPVLCNAYMEFVFSGCLRTFILNAGIFPTLQNYWPRACVMGNFLEILQGLVQETPLIIVSEVHKSRRYPCGRMCFLSFFLFQQCFNFSGIAKSKFSPGKSRVNQGVDWLNLLPSLVSLYLPPYCPFFIIVPPCNTCLNM